MDKDNKPFEYPDTAGYPDGTGFLDEGTASKSDPDPELPGAAEGES